jgi:hypothetical protein
VPDDFGGVRHLRKQLRGHERTHLDLAQAGLNQGVDPAALVGGRHGRLDGLKALARTDFADQDIGRLSAG